MESRRPPVCRRLRRDRDPGEDFGESGTQEKHHFTSYERDAESNQDYAVNRFHNFNVGRFSSADRTSGSAANPESWNRYSYGMNDPVNRSDQAGLDDDELPFYELSLDDIFAMLDGGGGGGGYGFDEFMTFFDDDPIVLSVTEALGPDESIDVFAGDDSSIDPFSGFVGIGFGGGDLGGGLVGEPDPQQQPRLSRGCRRALRRARQTPAAVRRARAAMNILSQAGNAQGVGPDVLAAVGIRETGFQNVRGDHRHGHGIFQFDDRSYPNARNFAYDPQSAANAAAGKLANDVNRFSAFGPDLAIAAALRLYNYGHPQSTLRILRRGGGERQLDRGTARRNYVSNVLNIARNCF